METTSIIRTSLIPPLSSAKAAQTQRENRTKRLARYQQVVDLHQKGVSGQDIARRVGLDPKTVSTWLAAGEFPERKPIPVGSRSLHPYLDYIHRRWDEGCHNAMQLWREIGGRAMTVVIRSRITARAFVGPVLQLSVQ
jgi:transposase